MAVSAADLNQIRVSTLGTPVDQATTWTTAPPGAANTLNTADRVINRAINALNSSVVNALGGTNAFSDRFSAVVGEEAAGDQAAFDAIGMNLIQAVAALIAGGGIAPTISLEFTFADPIATGDFVEVTATSDCTIEADLDGSEYEGLPQTDDMLFELTEQPSGDVIGQVMVAAGNIVTLSGIGGEVTAGTVLRMTAEDIVGGSVSPGAVIKIAAARKVAPTTAGRFVHEQTTAANSWTITHDLGFARVQPYVVRDTGAIMWPSVTYLSNDQCRLDFAQAVAGTAILRR